MIAELADVKDALEAGLPQRREELDALIRIPSVSAPGFDPAEVHRSAEAVRELLTSAGYAGAQLLEVGGAHPAVFAECRAARADAPTVLLYAHHDVQPPGDAEAWTSPPFEPVERNGRLYGRGSSDDKGGIAVHLASVAAWLAARGAPPVHVKVFIEGEEEIGSEHFAAFLAAHGELLRSDAVVITDSGNWKVGVPGITTRLRGLADCIVEVRALDHAVHSGQFGGPVPDPITGLLKLIASLTDEFGAVAVPELRAGIQEPTAAELKELEALDFDVASFRAEAGMLDGVDLSGDPTLHPLRKLWMEPNLTVIGIDAPAVTGSSNTLVPSARARLSLRLAPGQDAVAMRAALCAHLEAHAPWGLQVIVTPGAAGAPFVTQTDSPAFIAAEEALAAAFGVAPVAMGVGGSIPFIEPLTSAWGIPALLTGVGDPDCRAHGIDESLDLGDFAKACLAEAYLLATLEHALLLRSPRRLLVRSPRRLG